MRFVYVVREPERENKKCVDIILSNCIFIQHKMLSVDSCINHCFYPSIELQIITYIHLKNIKQKKIILIHLILSFKYFILFKLTI